MGDGVADELQGAALEGTGDALEAPAVNSSAQKKRNDGESEPGRTSTPEIRQRSSHTAVPS